MRGLVIGGVAGVVLALSALAFGFWGFLLVLVLGAVGAVVGGVVTGSIDVRSALAAARGGRRVG
jgi:uncharacterized membrane protein